MRFSTTAFTLSALIGAAINLAGAVPVHNATDSEVRELFARQGLAQVITTCTTPNTVAITFDDGPYNYLRDIVNTLDQYNAKGTFFFNGNNWGCIYSGNNVENIKYAYNHGHQLASHTWSHKDLTTLNWDQIHDEMWRVEQALMRIVGARPAFMRPPYGNYNDLVRQAAQVRGQKIANWDFDSGDSTGASAAQSNAAYDDLANRRPNTAIALNHETQSSTAYEVLPHALQVLSAKGYQFKTVAECLGQAPYQSFNTPEAGPFSC